MVTCTWLAAANVFFPKIEPQTRKVVPWVVRQLGWEFHCGRLARALDADATRAARGGVRPLPTHEP